MSKQYWLKRFKKGDYVQHLSGLTLNPSMHDHFVESWTESQEASHVSHFQAPENEKDKKTQGTYGQVSQMQFDFADPDGSSSKTCQDWLPLGCVTSCKTWDKWVTERRGAYSVRKKLALHTKGNECSSWPTPQQSEYKGAADPTRKDHRTQLRDVETGHLPQGMKWATPNTMDHLPPKTGEALARNKKKGGCKNLREDVNNPKMNGLQDQEKSNTSGKNQESWGTPSASDYKGSPGKNSTQKRITKQIKNPQKLNPNWVEQLMGLSTGWTDLGSWGMELSPKPQN